MTSLTVHHATLPDAGIEVLIDDFHDGLPMRIQHRPIGSDGWTRWSPAVDLAEVQDLRDAGGAEMTALAAWLLRRHDARKWAPTVFRGA